MAQHSNDNPSLSTEQELTTPLGKSVLETNVDIIQKRDTIPTSHLKLEKVSIKKEPHPGIELYEKLESRCEGTVVGDFEVIKLIGRGGMASVYHARQISMDREVALKILSIDYSEDEEMVARFNREAKVLGKLRHTNIIGCHAAGKINGLHYLAMEYVNGKSLKQILKSNGQLSVSDGVSVALDIARALKYAHENQIVHRDVKPDNILISNEGVIKVADLGLAKQEEEDLSLTASGIGMGTPIYMPPEQMRSAKHVDARVDIYALGVLLYVSLSKRRPFAAKDYPELLREKESGSYLSLRRKFTEIPEKLDLMIAKMIDPKPENRFQSAGEVIEALEKLNLASPFLSIELMFQQQKKQPAQKNTTRSGESTSLFTSASQPALKAGENVWFVRKIMQDSGFGPVRALSYDQLKHQIEARTIDSRSLASRSPHEGFQVLATFPEFDLLFRSLLVKVRAERRASKIKMEYEKIVHEVEDVERRKWWSRLFLSFGGWVKLALIIAMILGLAVLAYFYVPPLVMFFARYLGIVK